MTPSPVRRAAGRTRAPKSAAAPEGEKKGDPAEISKRNNEAEFFSMILDFVQDEHGEEQS